MSRLLNAIRSHNIDLDAVAINAYQQAYPGKAIPDKREDACSFVQPLIESIVSQWSGYTKVQQETSAVMEVAQLKKRIRELETQSPAGQAASIPQPAGSNNQPSQAINPKKPRTSASPVGKQTTLSFPSVSANAKSKGKGADGEVASPSTTPTHAAWNPTKPILKDHPIENVTKKGVDQWIQSIEKSLPYVQQQGLHQHIDEINKHFESISEELKPDLKDLTVRWGLPFKQATKLNQPSALKIVAVASYMAA